MSPAPADYVDVAERLKLFFKKYPDGSLQQVELRFVDVGGKWFVVYTAAAYRTPDDERPGHGTAWEPIPGPTNFTRDSEVQNCETSAWGRCLVAIGAADTRRGVASAQEIRHRREERAEQRADNSGRPQPEAEQGVATCCRCGESLAGHSARRVPEGLVHKDCAT